MSTILVYYRDASAIQDYVDMPAERKGEYCLNCNREHFHHSGWACNRNDIGEDFYHLPWDRRYRTISMLQSINASITGKYAYLHGAEGWAKNSSVSRSKNQGDDNGWRAWARVRPGECPCGIPSSQCRYHGDAKV